MEKEKAKLTFRGIIIAGINTFVGKVIGAVLLACFLWAFPGFRSLVKYHVFPTPAKNESQAEVERLKAELKRKEEALREAEAKKAEEERRRAELQRQIEVQKAVTAEKTKPTITPERPAMSDEAFAELCKSGDSKKVEEAIINGTNVNALDNNNQTSLSEAVMRGHINVVKLLLKYGADVNATSRYGWTALMSAAAYNIGTKIAEVLLQNNADVNAKDNRGWTALMVAASNGHTETAELLIKYGADVNAKDNDGWTALMMAARNGYTAISNLLRRYGAK